jgi:hypothetical protein
MDWNRVEGNWKEVKGKVKEKWGIQLADKSLGAPPPSGVVLRQLDTGTPATVSGSAQQTVEVGHITIVSQPQAGCST